MKEIYTCLNCNRILIEPKCFCKKPDIETINVEDNDIIVKNKHVKRGFYDKMSILRKK
jgi:hypothetical protein